MQPDLAGLDRRLDLAGELQRLGRLLGVEHRREARDDGGALAQLDVDVRQLPLVVDVRIVGNADPDRDRAAARERGVLDDGRGRSVIG